MECSLPYGFKENIENIVRAQEMSEISCLLTRLLQSIICFTKQTENKIQASEEALSGTYEEMFSNWKNKMSDAANRGDVFSSFMNLASLQGMFTEISHNIELPEFNIMDKFDPDNLANNTKVFDDALEKYRYEYEKLGIKPRFFKNIDEFVKVYLE